MVNILVGELGRVSDAVVPLVPPPDERPNHSAPTVLEIPINLSDIFNMLSKVIVTNR